ncbi:hypothetical protein BDV38DRAFT_183652 [Aspergillus pseudotamarii]|uniref:Uncharacterized protein n=1 Tax=Aspergillus pseudotamarii TaxID=132259 RepID=A0A5N6SIH8_ASPPS|nr:uncharacterized protein BDV38DRAFT_183652 [Aspergillus pseudotamarii]KAE8133550.1 hypothetical protein BDV38DRAFT_183652 [Aspergillus pseudotamarii]
MRFRPLVDGRPARTCGARAQTSSHVASACMPKPPMFAFPLTLVRPILDFLQNRGSTPENENGYKSRNGTTSSPELVQVLESHRPYKSRRLFSHVHFQMPSTSRVKIKQYIYIYKKVKKKKRRGVVCGDTYGLVQFLSLLSPDSVDPDVAGVIYQKRYF